MSSGWVFQVIDRVDVDEALNYARAYSGMPRSLEHARARSHSILLVAGRIVGGSRGGAGYGARCRNRTVVWHSQRRHVKFPALHPAWETGGIGPKIGS